MDVVSEKKDLLLHQGRGQSFGRKQFWRILTDCRSMLEYWLGLLLGTV